MNPLLLAALLLAPLARPASAQVEMGAAIGPDILLNNEKSVKTVPDAVGPLGLAASLSFDATTWASIGVSSAPAQRMTELLRRGYYKLEVIQLVLVARRGNAPLEELVRERDKGKKTLRELAVARGVDFDRVYEDALELDSRLVATLLPNVMSVAVSTAPASGAGRAKEKRR